MKLTISLVPEELESTSGGIFSKPDQLAGRNSQQLEPSDEEIKQALKDEKQEEKDKKQREHEEALEKKAKPDKGSDDKDDNDEDADSGDSEGGDDADDGDEGEGDDSEGDDDSEEGEDSDADEGLEEGEDDSDGEGSEEEGEGSEEEGADSDGEGSEEEDESEEEGDGEPEEEGDDVEEDEEEESTASARRIYRGAASAKTCLIISGFPGTGKTYTMEQLSGHYRIKDLDSSAYAKEGSWWEQYADDIERNAETHDVCFISSHEEIRAELRRRELRYTVVQPTRDQKVEYLTRYIRRNSPTRFVEEMERRWVDMVNSCEDDTSARIILKPGQYMTDAVRALMDPA